jgi:hypothetical protein
LPGDQKKKKKKKRRPCTRRRAAAPPRRDVVFATLRHGKSCDHERRKRHKTRGMAFSPLGEAALPGCFLEGACNGNVVGLCGGDECVGLFALSLNRAFTILRLKLIKATSNNMSLRL